MLNVFNILIHDVYRKNDKNCIKTLKVQKFWNFCHFFGNFSFKKTAFISSEYYWTTNSCLVERFQHSNRRCLSKKWQKMHENGENWESFEFVFFGVIFGSLWGHFRHSQKSPKIFTNTYRMELNLCKLNSVNVLLHIT